MQDKEIDHLFRSELAELEIQPSPIVWKNIAQKIDSGKRRKSWLPYLSVAASILFLVAIGLYFIPQVKSVQQKPMQITAYKNNKPVHAIVAPGVIKNASAASALADQPVVAKASVKGHNLNKTAARVQSNVLPAIVTEEKNEQVAQNMPRSAEIIKPVVPGAETRLTAQADISEADPAMLQQPLDIKNPPGEIKVLAANITRRHRINSLGDLINVVVSKVDKRKDKLIEFSGTDDDESTISGVNLGFVKLKKQD